MSNYIRIGLFIICIFAGTHSQVFADGAVGGISGGSSGGGGAVGGGGSPASSSSDASSSSSSNSSTTEPSSTTSSASSEPGSTTSSTSSAASTTNSDSGSTTPPPPPPPPSASTPSSGVEVISILETPSANYQHAVSTIEVDTISDEIVINGTGFNSGPNIILFDKFDNGGNTGDAIPLVNANNIGCSTDTFGLDVKSVPGPLIGCWTEYASIEPPIYDNIAHSGTHSMLGWGNIAQDNKVRKFIVDFPKSTNVFVSFWAHIPPGDIFPGRWWGASPVPGTFPNDSTWKFAWLLQDRGHDEIFANMCIPTHVAGNFLIAGNSNNIAEVQDAQQYWSWNNWTRMATWVRANPADLLAPGDMVFQAMSRDKGFYQASTTSTPIFVHKDPANPSTYGPYPGPTEKYYNSMSIPGWMRYEGDTVTKSALYDDIYVAIGPNAVSRVELGDAPTYLGNTRIAIQLPISWQDNQIKISLDDVEGIGISNAYLYITDSNGKFNMNGYPLH